MMKSVIVDLCGRSSLEWFHDHDHRPSSYAQCEAPTRRLALSQLRACRGSTGDRSFHSPGVTSESTTGYDRRPGRSRSAPRQTKRIGYAREDVEFYVLVDRAPKAARVTLFTEPDPQRGIYEREQS